MQLRTRGTTITGMSREDARKTAGLDWKVIPRPILVEGTTRNVKAEGYKALMRSDIRDGDPQPLAIASDKYEVFQNEAILDMMFDAAEAAGVDLERAGSYDGGRAIWAVTGTSSKAKAEVSVGDTISLKLRMTSGHGPGKAFNVQSIVERLVCSNGATATGVSEKVSISHRRKLTSRDLDSIKGLFQSAVEGFGDFIWKAKDLRNAATTTGLNRLIVAALLGQDILDEAIKATVPEMWRRLKTDRGQLLRDAADHIQRNHINIRWQEGTSTRHRNLIDEVVNETERFQVGRELAGNSLWNTYNGITHHFNHRNGRTADTGLESAFNGTGAKIMNRAFDLVYEVAQANK